MSVRNFLLKIGFLDLNQMRMSLFVQESEEKMIIWAFENGLYDIRLAAVHYFISTKSSRSISILHIAMNDEIEIVSQEAMLGLENVEISSQLIKEISEKRQFWIDENVYREGRRNRDHLKTSPLTESKERGSKKSLDNARSMLKKPMNGGKWF
jgi:hypothetical protein